MLAWWLIFSGTCRLSKACRKFGLRALPVDIANYDLTDQQQYKTLVEVLHVEKDFIVHLTVRHVVALRQEHVAERWLGSLSICSPSHFVAMTIQMVFQCWVKRSKGGLTVQTPLTKLQRTYSFC
jgi:hypothetical protein